MDQAEFRTIDGQIDAVARRTSHALLALDGLRRSPDPAMRLAYREVHDLVGDLGALRVTVGSLATPPRRTA
ncbi:hypothetical protein [Nocardioides lianchengensis]|uniref:Histidine kinase n=1 Tax=Nocardioides lianchengensis TaxID=1045774 RepID=A0A1G6WNI9_9ACTN|nr:hypothetical protein [Nocardioides lianchengensis]NYG09248.1 hypothetical protein [Nocardioides lianchengensis]SDD67442.1 hypothetical protein SAMN05421872_1109 [Nocardioides lianchengensis]